MRLHALALGLLPVPVAFAAAAHDGASGSHRRHHARAVQLEQRELAGQGFNDTNAMSMTASDAIATTSSSSSSISSAVSTTSSAISTTSSETSSLTTSTTSSSAVVTSSSSSSVAESSTSSAAAVVVPTSSSSAVSSLSTVSAAGPSTLASVPVVSSVTSIVQVTVSAATTTKAIPSSVVSSSANQDNTDSKSGGGLSKGAIIAIAVVAGVLGLIAIGWTLFRKWKLKPSNRFDDKMRPISFGPHGVADDEFFEKTLQRTASHSSADRQRQAYASELDNPNLVAGIPEHDFTAGGGGMGNTYDAYHQDPYYHAEAYEYNPAQQHAYAPGAYGVGQVYGAAPEHTDYPSQDAPVQDGYADLQRGNSQGSGSGHGHGSAHGHRSAHGHAPHQTFPNDFPSPENYLGRPTGMGDGPYAQAAQYRGL